MIIKNAQAGIMLKDVIVSDLVVKNQLAKLEKFDENEQTLDVDYNIINIDENEHEYFAEIELKTRITIKENRKIYFDLKVTHLGFFGAPKEEYSAQLDFYKAIELNGLASLISFARANIGSISGLIFCQGNIMIPMINVFKLNKIKEESKNINKD